MAKQKHTATRDHYIGSNPNLMRLTEINNTKTILEAVNNKKIAKDIWSICNIFGVSQEIQCTLASTKGGFDEKVIEGLFKKELKSSKNNDKDKDAIKNCLQVLSYCSTERVQNEFEEFNNIRKILNKANVPVYTNFGKKCTITKALEKLDSLEHTYLSPNSNTSDVVDENAVVALGEFPNMDGDTIN
ncbi:hypothetical protein [Rickettsia endosymbiont of Culicoides newsteadi]|uniref:hypothetical protein n=1 Tax=Rickettsia endosymbiont of Culicoides newsteadi TaxID=1961830 RepID=UPI000B9C3E9E|nr:hypothetical protein [Rickettsia endosymbiont of Culicoides newsteadi]OZG31712.1 hypothetical protein RiCNE_08960 [Rickettsia endosymbiont of Culicoides newsteadi]